MSAPEWAIKAACERINVNLGVYQMGLLGKLEDVMVGNLASYIAEHEEEPVDPLILEARELTAQYYEASACYMAAKDIRDGGHDSEADSIGGEFGLAYAALKRGKELGQEQSS